MTNMYKQSVIGRCPVMLSRSGRKGGTTLFQLWQRHMPG